MSRDNSRRNGIYAIVRGRHTPMQKSKTPTTMSKSNKTKKAQKPGKSAIKWSSNWITFITNQQAHLTLTFSKMSIKQFKTELKPKNAKGFSQKNKAELIKQLKKIGECESSNLRQSADWIGSSWINDKFENSCQQKLFRVALLLDFLTTLFFWIFVTTVCYIYVHVS